MARSESIFELEQLRLRLEEAEETIQAIRSGKVDALVVSGPRGEQIYTLQGADHSYRILLEDMNEGAATLLPDGAVLYCNKAFAGMLKMPIEKAIGFSANDLVAQSDRQAFADLLRQGEQGKAKSLSVGLMEPLCRCTAPLAPWKSMKQGVSASRLRT
jgi:PAS domain-containing protein